MRLENGKRHENGKGIAYSLKRSGVLWLPFCGEIVFVDGTVPAVWALSVGIGREDFGWNRA